MKIFKVILLYPISLIYGFVVKLRNTLFDLKILKSHEFDIPIISVGNITVGGTGKTPVTEYLISILKENYKVAVLSRGYKRKTKGFILAENKSDVNSIGDEPYQIKQKFPQITLAVDGNRVRGIKKLQESDKKIDLIILDDAFQHRYVKPGLSILLIDFTQPFFDDYYLPFGRLRDSIKEKHRADIILLTKAPKDIKPIDMRIIATNINLKAYQTLFFSTFSYNKFYSVHKDINKTINIEDLKNAVILLVTGIGNHKQILLQCSGISKEIIHEKYKDHHEYTESDMNNISKIFNNIKSENKFILTTEKDAGKLKRLICDDNLKTKMFYCPIEISILNDDQDELNQRIFSYIKKDKGQYRFLISRKQF